MAMGKANRTTKPAPPDDENAAGPLSAAVASWFAVFKRIASGKGGVAAHGARLTLQAKREKQ